MNCTKKEDVPRGPHYALLTFDSFYYTENMGHGYETVGQSMDTVKYETFLDQKEWTDATLRAHRAGEKCVAVHVDKVAAIKTTVDVQF